MSLFDWEGSLCQNPGCGNCQNPACGNCQTESVPSIRRVLLCQTNEIRSVPSVRHFFVFPILICNPAWWCCYLTSMLHSMLARGGLGVTPLKNFYYPPKKMLTPRKKIYDPVLWPCHYKKGRYGCLHRWARSKMVGGHEKKVREVIYCISPLICRGLIKIWPFFLAGAATIELKF